MARYQQGIGIRDAGEVHSTFSAPTMWREPKAPAINRLTFTAPNTGASRNYGSTPSYVNTVPSRWEHGEKGALFNAATGMGNASRTKQRAEQRYDRKKTKVDAKEEQRIANNPYSTSYEGAVQQGQRAPQIAEAQKVQNVYDQAWREYKNDPFMKAIREADPSSGAPISTVEWKDEPTNPLPVGTFNPSEVSSPIENPFPAGTYFPPTSSITSAPNTRTQNRSLK